MMLQPRRFSQTNALGSPVRVSSVGTDLDTKIPHLDPHYTDERFRHAQLVWGTDVEGLAWEYSDRLSQWDYEKNQSSWEKAKKEGFSLGTARFFQAHLSNYFDEEIELIGIMTGWNWSTGYSYKIYGYRVKENKNAS